MVEEVIKEEEIVEEVSYDDAFNAQFGDGNVAEPKEPELKVEEEEIEEEEPKKEDKTEASKEEKGNVFASPRDQYDWIEGLPEEQREMAERLKHEALSDRGRVSALTRKVNEITTELAAKVRPIVAPANEEVDVSTAPELSDALKELQEDYPELGKKLTAILAEREETLKKDFSDQLDPIKEMQTADAKASNKAQLDVAGAEIFKTEETSIHWQDVVASEDFAAWLELQPEFIQTTARESENVQSGIDVLRMYEHDYQAAVVRQSSSDDTDKDTLEGDKIKAKRQQRKATTVSPESRPASTDSDEYSGDYESMFNAQFGTPKK